VFLLSPANMRGVRAGQLHRSRFELSGLKFGTSPNFELQTSNAASKGLSLEEAFTYASSLYFRGKIAYARRFVNPPPCCGEGIYVIAPGFGLVPPDWIIDAPRFSTLRDVPADPAVLAFRKPLEAHALELLKRLQPETSVVLLGSLAQRKYLEVLGPILGSRLQVPKAFVGTGDMRRGALLLRAVTRGRELEYLACAHLVQREQKETRRKRRRR
jgi:hypothetical protein